VFFQVLGKGEVSQHDLGNKGFPKPERSSGENDRPMLHFGIEVRARLGLKQ
jgi:hypothetical protein